MAAPIGGLNALEKVLACNASRETSNASLRGRYSVEVRLERASSRSSDQKEDLKSVQTAAAFTSENGDLAFDRDAIASAALLAASTTVLNAPRLP